MQEKQANCLAHRSVAVPATSQRYFHAVPLQNEMLAPRFPSILGKDESDQVRSEIKPILVLRYTRHVSCHTFVSQQDPHFGEGLASGGALHPKLALGSPNNFGPPGLSEGTEAWQCLITSELAKQTRASVAV